MLCPFAHPVDMFLFFIILDMVLKQLSSFEGGKERGGGRERGGVVTKLSELVVK